MFAFSTLIVAASLAATVAADHGHDLSVRSHHHVGRSNLQKRFSGTATYYAVGLGACGQNNVPSDFIVALNTAQYGGGYPGPNCFKPITICAKGKCVGATIMDQCPTCGYGSLDLSEGLFKQFADTGDGVFQMTWSRYYIPRS
ncbi:rare lipoprotein A-like double-psi beta-barrel protein [Rhizoctonia solani 123E]|uniref:Rare lipoprotein A-like double-psi beta-barrel protein n=1 Tax=Rhizoctonia solani 123E TaxID=1423351 RepID=A0A074S8L0_9AGAM|nr:rare lipoprotein A-like double-psi beta-barrel protein [Rhizoctonia solani 123E]